MEDLTQEQYPGFDAVHKTRGALRSSSQSLPNLPKTYQVFDKELLTPEFLVEFSLESNSDLLTTQLERLTLDLAYSSKLSHSNMPHIISPLIEKLEKKKASLFFIKEHRSLTFAISLFTFD